MVKKAISHRKAEFIDTMDCLSVTKLPEGPEWTYELKLDGYRLEAVRTGGETTLYSRRRNILNEKFPYVVSALNSLPEDTVIDGELVAMGPDGRPNFNLLQNFRSAESHITYYAFDVLVHKGKDLTMLPLSERRKILHPVIKPSEHLALSEVSDQTASQMLSFVRSHGLEGIVAKRADGVYQPGMRTGVWSKHRINLGQEFVVGGYRPACFSGRFANGHRLPPGNSCLRNLPALRTIGFQANRRLLQVEQISHDCLLSAGAFQKVNTGFCPALRGSASPGVVECAVVVSTSPHRLLEPGPARPSGAITRPTTGRPDTRENDLPSPLPASSWHDRTNPQQSPISFDRSRLTLRMVFHSHLLAHPQAGAGQNPASTLNPKLHAPSINSIKKRRRG